MSQRKSSLIADLQVVFQMLIVIFLRETEFTQKFCLTRRSVFPTKSDKISIYLSPNFCMSMCRLCRQHVFFACASALIGQRNYKMAAVLTSSLPKLTNLWSNSLRCLHISTILSQIRIRKRPICTASDYNPFFHQETLPRFSELRTAHVIPAIKKLTQNFENDFTEFEAKLAG